MKHLEIFRGDFAGKMHGNPRLITHLNVLGSYPVRSESRYVENNIAG
jgi:hypothetical protein